jgi:putative oxidoreductase
MVNIFYDILILCARIFISSLFIWAGVAKIMHWKGTLEYMHSKRVPWAGFLLPLAVLIQVLGGLSLLLGWHVRIAALVLFIFMVPAMIKMHDFWKCKGREERTREKTFFMKDVAILGSLLLLFVTGAGRISFHG